MHYQINVSKNGKHYFATDARSLRGSREEAQSMARHFQQLFPAADGYAVNLTMYSTSGTNVDIDAEYDLYGRPMKCSACGTTKNIHPDFGSGGPYRCNSADCIVL